MSVILIGMALNREPVLGVIYNPFTQELLTAVSGQGATCNGSPIRVSDRCALSEATVLTNIPADRSAERCTTVLGQISALMKHPARGVRMLGSAGLSLSMVAMGRSEGARASSSFGSLPSSPFAVMSSSNCL